MAKDLICLVSPEQLDQYYGIIALDIDGVFADTWLNHIRYDHPGIIDPRLIQLADEQAELLATRAIKKADVHGIQFESLAYLASLAVLTNSGFVIVSSWITNPDTSKGVQQIFDLLKVEYDKPFVVGQTHGGGGFYREEGFFNWLRKFCDRDKPKAIAAIDDSGYRHFPVLHQTNNLVAPVGRLGYNMDDYIRSIRKLDFDDDNWYGWCRHGYVTGAETPEFTKEEMWELMWEGRIRSLYNTHWNPKGKGEILWKLKRYLNSKKANTTWLFNVLQKLTSPKQKTGK